MSQHSDCVEEVEDKITPFFPWPSGGLWSLSWVAFDRRTTGAWGPTWLVAPGLGSVSKRPFLSWRKPREMAWNHFISWLAVQEYRHQLNIWHTLQNKDKIRVHSSCQIMEIMHLLPVHNGWYLYILILIWLLYWEIWVPGTKVGFPLASWGDLNNRDIALALGPLCWGAINT